MKAADAPFLEAPGKSQEILAPHAAGDAGGVSAGPAYDGDGQVFPGVRLFTPGPTLHHPAQGLMAQDQIVGPRGRRAILEGTDFLVGPADPDIQHFEFHFVGTLEGGRRGVDQVDLFLGGKNGDGFHAHLTKNGSRKKTPPDTPHHKGLGRLFS